MTEPLPAYARAARERVLAVGLALRLLPWPRCACAENRVPVTALAGWQAHEYGGVRRDRRGRLPPMAAGDGIYLRGSPSSVRSAPAAPGLGRDPRAQGRD